jgi:hypothetical protein
MCVCVCVCVCVCITYITSYSVAQDCKMEDQDPQFVVNDGENVSCVYSQ